jgi:hypothetical protein
MKRLPYAGICVALVAGTVWSASMEPYPLARSVWYVDASASAGGDGTSWATAFDTIHDAVDAAASYLVARVTPLDQIWVRSGTYVLSAEIEVDKKVAIYGGFDGTETALTDRDWEANDTTVDGNGAVRCFNVTEVCILDGFTITDGAAAGGAGVKLDCPPEGTFAWGGTVSTKILNCTLSGNNATAGGGGICDFYSDSYVENCTFYENSADRGGAFYHWESSPEIEKCVFMYNVTTSSSSYGGGALCGDYLCYGSITNCVFALNYSNSWGGAISYHMSYPEIINCTFADNEAAHYGGALMTNVAAPTLRNCIVWENVPDQHYHAVGADMPFIVYSDVDGGYAGPGYDNIDADPLFLGTGNYRLAAGSPCIDAASGTNAPDDDIRGIARPQDGDGDGTASFDMGAYEYWDPFDPIPVEFDRF